MKKTFLLLIVIILTIVSVSCSKNNENIENNNFPNTNENNPVNTEEEIEKIIEEMQTKYYKKDEEKSDINELAKALWSIQGGGLLIVTMVKEEDEYVVTNIIDLYESGRDDYTEKIADEYQPHGSEIAYSERFIELFNNKLEKEIPLISYKNKDLIISFEFADGDTIVFNGFYKSALNMAGIDFSDRIIEGDKISRNVQDKLDNIIQNIQKANWELKDKEILNIDKYIEASQCSYCGGIKVFIMKDKESGEVDINFEINFNNSFPNYALEVERNNEILKVINQINKKTENGVKLKSYVSNGLVFTFAFMDGDKIIFDGCYQDVLETVMDK